MRPLLALGSLALALLLVLACKTPAEKAAANSSDADREPVYEAGVLVFKLRDDTKTTLPPYDHGAPQLGDYPHLGDLLPTYRVKSIAAVAAGIYSPEINRYYKIHFDPAVSLDEFSAALERVDIVEFTEKVPVNAPKSQD